MLPPTPGQLVSPDRHTHCPDSQAWVAVHTLPTVAAQPPQLLGSFCTLVQLAAGPTPQVVPPMAQLQAPELQTSPSMHGLAQLPQWEGSVVSVVQLAVVPVPQVVSPAGQPHVPDVQTSPAGHDLPHVPQLATSVAVLTQPRIVPQSVWPAPQVQTPETQVAPGSHSLPQLPQSFVSLVVSTQPRIAPQSVSPVIEQVQVADVPVPVQVCPGPQTLPQAPQFWAFTVVQALLQMICPVAQVVVQVPPTHVWFVEHLWFALPVVQPPQLSGSVEMSVHVLGVPVGGHLTSAPGQAPHALLLHVAPIAHAVPQAPQLEGSLVVSTQTPLHAV